MFAPSHWFTLRRPTALVTLTAALVLFVGLAWNARAARGPVQAMDLGVARFLNRQVGPHPDVVSWWKVVTNAGSPVVWDTVAAVVVVVLLVRGRRRLALLGVVSLAGAAVLSTVLKNLIGRPRPRLPITVEHAAGLSFPSGHAMTSIVAVGFLLVVGRSSGPRTVRRWMAASAGVVVLLIGVSRLVLGVHYVTDVIGGWLAGALWFVAVLVLVVRDAAGSGQVRFRPGPARWTPTSAADVRSGRGPDR